MNVMLRFVFAVHGCCKDGAMPALGPNYEGCPGESALVFSKTSRDYIENNSNKNHLDKQQQREQYIVKLRGCVTAVYFSLLIP